MERTISVEDRIRRAEEIYTRRKSNVNYDSKVRYKEELGLDKSINNSKNMKNIKSIRNRIIKKLVVQVCISILIYIVLTNIKTEEGKIYTDIFNKTNEILSTNLNFNEIYDNLKNEIDKYNKAIFNNEEEKEDNIESNGSNENLNENNNENNNENEGVDNSENIVTEDNLNNNENQIGGNTVQEIPLTSEEQKILDIKETISFIKPLEGVITSRYGYRETTNPDIPKDHTGIDIAANTGTKIVSSTEGEVVLVSDQGDYGKHVKIQIGEVSLIYAHCENIYVQLGDFVTQGQEIAEVGSTGNSTGPHLHFEIRISEQIVNPESILEF